jgi:hypothetical protein
MRMTAFESHTMITVLATSAPAVVQLIEDVAGWAPAPHAVRYPLPTVAVMVRLNATPVAAAGTPDVLAVQATARNSPGAIVPLAPP